MDSNPTENQHAEYCHVCGKPAAASWHGAQVIAICEECAVNDLPSLIADSIALHPGRGSDRTKFVVLQIELRFWKAIAFRLMKELQE